MKDDDLVKKIQNVRDGVMEYRWCDCYALGEQPVCGCTKHELRLYRDHVIHWLGLHWEIECAFKYAITGLGQSFNIFKYMSDEDVI